MRYIHTSDLASVLYPDSKTAGYLQIKGVPLASWSGPELAHSPCCGQGLGCIHLLWETCSCSDWHVAVRCPGLWTLNWLCSSHWGWHVPCRHPRRLRPCCRMGRKNSWKADRNLGKERSSRQRDEGRRDCPSDWSGGIGSPGQTFYYSSWLPPLLTSSIEEWVKG